MIIIILGAPGSGKGTQAELIKKEFNLDHISTGELIRNEIKKKTKNSAIINQYLKQGKLIPNNIIINILYSKLKKNNILLDGFPRNIDQAVFIAKKNITINYIINIFTKETTIIKRIKYRLTKYLKNYNIIHDYPKIKNRDDITGEKLTKRTDDLLNIIKTRFIEYNKYKKELIDWYKNRTDNTKIIDVNGETAIKDILFFIKKNIINYEKNI